MKRVEWRVYRIGTCRADARDFLAPDLDTAFALARAVWPISKEWKCYGGSKDE